MTAEPLTDLAARVVRRWPRHAAHVTMSLAGRSPAVVETSNQLAANIFKLADAAVGGLDGLIDDYRFLCEKVVLPEELHFRRHGRYRLSRFADAERECYANPGFMARYMSGLLVSQAMWANHAQAFDAYRHGYLSRLPDGAAHLEVGPGHGMFLHFAAREAKVGHVEAWDISPASIVQTRRALDILGAARPVELKLANLFDAQYGGRAEFDGVVMSEILEHLEDPVAALRTACGRLKPGGLLWVNVPANSPSPDHIFLVNDLAHAESLVRTAGLEVVESSAFPASGKTLAQATRGKLSVSCVVLGRKPAVASS